MKTILAATLLAATLQCQGAALGPPVAATAPVTSLQVKQALQAPEPAQGDSLAARLLNLSVATYGTVNWSALAGKGTLGVGVYLQSDIARHVSIRLRGEADSWQPEDYFLDRGWADVVLRAPVGHGAELYGFGGFGYQVGHESRPSYQEGGGPKQRDGEAVLAHAGGGLSYKLLGKDRGAKVSAFFEGSLFASTAETHGAGLAAGISLAFK